MHLFYHKQWKKRIKKGQKVTVTYFIRSCATSIRN